MATIDSVTRQVADPATAEKFYADAFDLGPLLQLSPSEAPTSGFRGFTMSLVVAQPSTADALISDARTAGATIIKPAAARSEERQVWKQVNEIEYESDSNSKRMVI